MLYFTLQKQRLILIAKLVINPQTAKY